MNSYLTEQDLIRFLQDNLRLDVDMSRSNDETVEVSVTIKLCLDDGSIVKLAEDNHYHTVPWAQSCNCSGGGCG
jgi:hypothetical protein